MKPVNQMRLEVGPLTFEPSPGWLRARVGNVMVTRLLLQ
jgi:hypothetical protein